MVNLSSLGTSLEIIGTGELIQYQKMQTIKAPDIDHQGDTTYNST
jgi:hypothetical protein